MWPNALPQSGSIGDFEGEDVVRDILINLNDEIDKVS